MYLKKHDAIKFYRKYCCIIYRRMEGFLLLFFELLAEGGVVVMLA